MTGARHKAAFLNAARRTRTRILFAGLATTLAAGSVAGVAAFGGDQPLTFESPATMAAGAINARVAGEEMADRLADRRQNISRAARRVTIEDKPVAKGHRFTTVPLNVRTGPNDKQKLVTVLATASRVTITGERKGRWAEIIIGGKGLWVSAVYLATTKPKPEPKPKPKPEPRRQSQSQPAATATRSPAPSAPTTGGSCTAPAPSGVTSSAMAVYRAVCSSFPSIRTYGGWRGDGEHSDGRAIDIMVSGDLGWQVANYLHANAGRFGLYDIIYSQRIWTRQRSAEGWRGMSDRGSTTANHYDHVHVKVF